MGKKITDYLLYRWRYVIGYSIIGTMIAVLLLIAGLYVPGGLTQSEMASTVQSHNFSFKSIESFDPSTIINLPYNVLQRISTELLGVSNFSIKLPSLLLGALSAFGMILLLQMWFRRNVAVLTTVLIITTGQFLFVAQNGTPSIVYIFWSVWLLVAAMMISRKARFMGLWKIVLFSVAALSLYTPLSAYILIALTSAVILHPHLRYLVRQLMKARLKITIATFCALLVMTPLIYAIVKDPSVGFTLLGIPDVMPDLKTNLFELLEQYFSFATPIVGVVMSPIYSLGSTILIVLGIIRLSTTNYTARSYIITAWAILLLPVLLINPNFSMITFVPAMLLMAMGINMILRSWYQLFPRNPYARIAGLLPLTILIGGMFVSGVSRYVYNYTYNPNTASYFSQDLRLINEQLAVKDRPATTILVTPDEKRFYDIVVERRYKVTVTADHVATTAPLTIVSRAAHQTDGFGTPNNIVTNSRSELADRFYIYKSQ
ncbi:MAG: conserved rane protein of unknown function [Candidatus Saccharibacteria bacterium]|nr:conserved rane protein of unknown function [Candidatus Saccharibacteria bacterium]